MDRIEEKEFWGFCWKEIDRIYIQLKKKNFETFSK